MNQNLLFLTDVFCPALAGLFFVFYGLYFLQLSRADEDRHGTGFGFYLLFFGVFLMTRPVQLLLGPHPWPLIVNSLRVLIFCGVCGPLLLDFSLSLSKRRPRTRALFAAGLGLGLIHTCFNLLGTTGSQVVFRLGDLTARDTLTPAMRPPWFGREGTIVITVLAGLLFFGAASWLTLGDAHRKKRAGQPYRQLLGFGLGTLVFFLSFILGMVSKAWWFYYLASVPSAALMGYGVLADIRLLRQRLGRVMPFVREELFHVLTAGGDDGERLHELMGLLGKSDIPDTVVIVERARTESGGGILDAHAEFAGVLRETLQSRFGNRFLLVSVGSERCAVCVDSQACAPEEISRTVLDRIGDDDRLQCYIGLGLPHATRDLQRSYFEALNAVRFARDQQMPYASYRDVSDRSAASLYPKNEREELLGEVRNGNHASIMRRLDIFLDQLTSFCDNEPAIVRNRLGDVLGLLVNAAIDNGADSARACEISDEAQAEMPRLKRTDDLLAYFRGVVQNLPVQPATEQLGGGTAAVAKVRAFLEAKYREDVTLERAAQAAGISASHLQRLLKEKDETFSALLAKTRLAKARELLHTSREPISRIAFQVGFNDSNYFSTVFKKYEGITPRQFRKEARVTAAPNANSET